MGAYSVEIDEIRDNLVVVAVPALRMLVFGRTIDEAVTRAKSSIAFRLLEPGSHIVMQQHLEASTVTVAVPGHRELRRGTLLAIIRQSRLPRRLRRAHGPHPVRHGRLNLKNRGPHKWLPQRPDERPERPILRSKSARKRCLEECKPDSV